MSTLADIRLKVRRITKSPSRSQLTDSELDDYINAFYQYDLPEHLRLLNLKETFTLTLQPNIDIYNFTPNTFVSIEPPCYVGGYEIQYFQDREQYFSVYPELQRVETLDTGDGTAGAYSGTITATPIKRNRVFISTVDAGGNPLSATDSTAGTFTGDVLAGSTINYTTGAIAALTFTSAIASGTNIQVQYVNYTASRPLAVLFYDDTFQFSPPPDQGYQFEINAYVTPTALANAADVPELNEWWQLIAYGASQKIFEDRLDMESFAKVEPLLDRALRLAERRTMKQLSNQRVATIFSDQYIYRNPFNSGT